MCCHSDIDVCEVSRLVTHPTTKVAQHSAELPRVPSKRLQHHRQSKHTARQTFRLTCAMKTNMLLSMMLTQMALRMMQHQTCSTTWPKLQKMAVKTVDQNRMMNGHADPRNRTSKPKKMVKCLSMGVMASLWGMTGTLHPTKTFWASCKKRMLNCCSVRWHCRQLLAQTR